MWDIPRLYITACSNSVSLVPFHTIAISILFHHYKELIECRKHSAVLIKQMRLKVEEGLQKIREDSPPPREPTLFDFFDK
jgi:hypothetical protein